MCQCSSRVWCVFALATVFLCGCQTGESPPDQDQGVPDAKLAADKSEVVRKDQPLTVVLRSVKPARKTPEGQRQVEPAYGLTWADYQRLEKLANLLIRLPMRIVPLREVRRQERLFKARVVATTTEYADANPFTLSAGRFFTDEEDQILDNVIVLGSRAARQLFPSAAAVGNSVQLGRYFYRVVGVIKDRKSQETTNQTGEDFNQDVYIPIKTCQARFGKQIVTRVAGIRTVDQVELHQITLIFSDRTRKQDAVEAVQSLLKRHHANKDWDVSVPSKP